MKSVCLAILNYNGIRHLECLLPTVDEAIGGYPGSCRALVLDNQSTQGDADWVRAHYPSIEVAEAPANDYLYSYNWLLPQLSEDIVVLLNNDLRLSPNFLSPLLRHFDRDDVFAVSATSLDWEGRNYTCGPARLSHHHGLYFWDYDRARQELSHTLFASGGFSAVCRKKFVELHGFNRLFWPAYGEDLDLCFRAWRAGWRSVFEPASVVYHRESGTFATPRNGRATRLMRRCRLLFQWSTLPSAAGWAERSAMLMLTALRFALKGDWAWAETWMRTWLHWQWVRRDYQFMKVPISGLSEIVRRIESTFPERGAVTLSTCKECTRQEQANR